MVVNIRPVESGDRAEWLRMRAALWPETSAAEHAAEVDAFLAGDLSSWLVGLWAAATFVAVRPAGGLSGFLEASVRPMADGCTTSPAGYVEGWYVDPDVRREGIGRGMLAAAEAWAAAAGCREMASDAQADNTLSRAAHQAAGFLHQAPTIQFHKRLSEAPPARRLTLETVAGRYAVCRLDRDAAVPHWAIGSFVSVSRTADELSVVCSEELIPPDVRAERNWRCLRVAGKIEFAMVGVLARLVGPIAAAGISVFVVSTFDSDYLMVRDGDFERAAQVLRNAGHSVCV